MGKTLVNIDEVIAKAAKQAVKEFNQERIKENKKKVFHNTRLLLKHYNDFKQHLNNAVSDMTQIDDTKFFEDLQEGIEGDVYISAIKKSKTRTAIMIAHIDKALKILEAKQEVADQIEKFEAIKLFYIDGVEFEEILKRLNCSEATLRRWMNAMINELSIGLFGVDGLKLDMI